MSYDSDPAKIRGSLIVVSLTIIIYIIGGGHLIHEDGTNKVSLLGGSIHFDYPIVLQSTVVITFFYLLNRYYIEYHSKHSEIMTEIYAGLLTSKLYIKTTLKYAYQFKQPQTTKHDPNVLLKAYKSAVDKHALNDEVINVARLPVFNKFAFPSKVANTASSSMRVTEYYQSHLQYKNGGHIINNEEVNISKIDSLLITVISDFTVIRLLKNNKKIYQYYFPYFLAGIAAIIMYMNLIIHFSLKFIWNFA